MMFSVFDTTCQIYERKMPVLLLNIILFIQFFPIIILATQHVETVVDSTKIYRYQFDEEQKRIVPLRDDQQEQEKPEQNQRKTFSPITTTCISYLIKYDDLFDLSKLQNWIQTKHIKTPIVITITNHVSAFDQHNISNAEVASTVIISFLESVGFSSDLILKTMKISSSKQDDMIDAIEITIFFE